MRRKDALAILMATTLSGLIAVPALAVDDLSLNVAPGTECVSASDTITVTLDVANLSSAINGVQVLLEYDDTLMTLVDIVPTDLGLTLPASGWDEISQTDNAGDITWAASINGGSIGINHTIATLTFTAIADGTADVIFRPDVDPFYTKLTKASDSTTIFPTKYDTTDDFNGDGVGDAFIGPPDCTITAEDEVCDGTAGHVASVPDAGVGATYAWTVTGGTIFSGQGTDSITYTATDPSTVTIDITVTDANGCDSTCQKIVTVNANPDCTITAASTVCANATGIVASVPDAGVGATYDWTVTGGTITAGSGTNSITYTSGAGPTVTIDITITDANGCVSTCQEVVTVSAPDCTITAEDEVCDGSSGHVASVPDAGGGAVYTWSVTGGTLDSGQGTTSISYTAGAGPTVTIDVNVVAGDSCESDCQKVVTVNANPTADAGADVTLCADAADPAMGGAPTASGGTGPYTYSWTDTAAAFLSDTAAANPTFDVATAGPGTYDACVTVTDANTCVSVTDCAVITINELPTADAGADVTLCADAADPAVGGAPTASGGAGPYTYSWTDTAAAFLSDTAAANPTFDVATAGPGTYTACVTVTDANTCVSSTDCATVTVNELPTADAGADVTVCADAADPSVGGAPTGSGGTGPYTYAWSGTGAAFLSDTAAANPTFDVATAGPGTYDACVTVTDANTCVSAIDCATVTVNALPVADAGGDVTLCGDAADPTVGGAPTASGGLGPYTYAWTGTAAAFLSDSAAANPTFDVATAGAGSYQACVTVTDANTCVSATDCATIVIDELPVADAGSDLALCANAPDPTVGGTPTASGGLGPYTYAWTDTGAAFLSDTAAANPTFDVASAGVGTFDICVTVTDANTCVSLTDCATITVNLVLDCTITTDDPVCAGTSHTASVGSAGAGATYDWTVTGGTQDTPDDFNTMDWTAGAGPTVTIDIVVTDINSCTNTCQTVVTVNDNPTADAGADVTVCADAADPSVGGAPTASGGTGPYTYAWSGTAAAFLSDTAAANPTFDVATAGPGTYDACVTVTDANTCVGVIDCATVTVNDLPVADAGADIELCADAGDPAVGSAPTASGGTGPYTYAWSGTAAAFLSDTAAANPTFDVATAGPGVYDACVTVTDANTCVSAIDCATITIDDLPIADAGSDVVVCADAADPTVGGGPTGSGGLGPYTYAWTGTAAAFLSDTAAENPTFDVATAGPGVYQACVTVTDANACVSATDCADVTVNALPDCTITADSLVCAGTSGHAASAPAGAVSYAWSVTGGTIDSGQGTNAISYTAGTGTSLTIEVTVTDANGCVNICQEVVTVNAPSAVISADDAVCYQSTGNLATVPDAGVGATYDWTVTGGTKTSQIGNSITYAAGTGATVTLDVTVTNSNGCSSVGQKIVTIIQPSIEVTLELEAVGAVVTRDVTFVVTDCPGTTDVRVLPVTTDATGVGSVTIPSTSPTAAYVSAQEGHTLKKLASVTYGACFVATVDLTGVNRLAAGDFHTGVVSQDNLVDITDFSVLASRWNNPIDANLSTGADATGDGVQDTADFTAIQVNFFAVGEADDACGGAAIVDSGIQPIGSDGIAVLGSPSRQTEVVARASVPVQKLEFPGAEKADLTGDGLVDARDIRAFARRHGLQLLPEFEKKLGKLEGRRVRQTRGR
ncbi:MAG: cohesin domain-containing protein [Phycisphaerae bacterium]|jgi:hypothetical protein